MDAYMQGINLDALRVGSPTDVRPAALRVQEMVRDLVDLRVAMSHNIAVKQQMLDADGNVLATSVFGWTGVDLDRWWRNPRHALHSPLPLACRYESEPFWINAEGIRTQLPNPLLESIDLTNFERRGLTPSAIVVPVHLPFGQIGAASFQPRSQDRTDLSREFEAYGDVLGVIARTFIAGYVRTMGPPKSLPIDATLSEREVECLRLAAVGKTDHEIGAILSRSRATIRFHIQNASMKLDTVNRSQTIFKAARLGYIGANFSEN